MATPDSGDYKVCDIINCVAIYYEKGASGNAFLRKEKFRAQISRKVWSLKALKETVRFVYFLNLICSWLFRPCKSFYCDTHVFTVCIWWIRSDLAWPLCPLLYCPLCCDCLWSTRSSLDNRKWLIIFKLVVIKDYESAFDAVTLIQIP